MAETTPFPGSATLVPGEEMPKLPTPEEAKKELANFNKMLIDQFRGDVKIEAAQYKHMLELSGKESKFIEDDLEDIVILMLESARNRVEKSFGGMARVDQILSLYMRYIDAIFSGHCLSPIYGTENEWQDITDPKDAKDGNTFVATVNGEKVTIPFTKLEVNRRMRTLFRLNGDNRYAHRTDFIAFVDPMKPDETHLNDDSIRFVKFPYNGETLTCHCTFKDGKVDQYLSCTEEFIKNGNVFPTPDVDMSNPETYDHYMICPKIPFDMLEAVGIDLDAQIEQYLKDAQDERESFMRKSQPMQMVETGEAPDDPENDGEVDPDAIPDDEDEDEE